MQEAAPDLLEAAPEVVTEMRPIQLLQVSAGVLFCALASASASTIDVSAVTSAASPPPPVSVQLGYAQSQDAWTTVNQVESAKGNLDQINQVLHDNYGTYEEAFAHAAVGVSGIHSGIDSPLLRTLYFGTSSDALAFGRVQNPVVPELKADAILAGEIASGFDGLLGEPEGERDTGLRTHIGGHFGMGYEKRIDAVSTDLIESIPTQDGRLSYYGFDLGTSHDTSLAPGLAIRSSAAVSDTDFRSSIDGSSNSYVRWKLKNDVSGNLGSLLLGRDSLVLETVLGPQPLPVDFLPRTWDYVDQLNPLPELGAMTGAGLAWSSEWSNSLSRNWKLVARGGFYGGYPGGQISLHAGDFSTSIETWGIEASSAYQTLGQRVYAAALGVSL